jgi:integrase
MDLGTIAQASPYFQDSFMAAKPACTLTPDLEFSVAASQWLASRSVISDSSSITHRGRYIRRNTAHGYEDQIKSLALFFGGHSLAEIQLGHFEAYQKARLEGSAPFIRYRRPQDAKDKMQGGVLIPAKGKTSCPARPKKINQELGLLMRIMKRAECWTDHFDEYYQPLLDDEAEIPRALTAEEQRKWLEIAGSQSRWNVIRWYSIVLFETCMSTDEIRGLRVGDINLQQRIVTVSRRSAKNSYRARTIELMSADVLWALDCLLTLARSRGANKHTHFLFPWRACINVFDPTRPMTESGIKAFWNEVREASGLTGFRQYDCRHTAITRLAEAGVPTDVIMARAGHVSEKMRRHYTHISQASQRKWLEHSQRFHHVDRTALAFSYARKSEIRWDLYTRTDRKSM